MSITLTRCLVAWLNCNKTSQHFFNLNFLNMDFLRKFYMPFINVPACNNDCSDQSVFPNTSPCPTGELASGGINELYLIPCSETMSAANVTSLDWWQGLVDDDKLGRSGLGLGSLSKTGQTTARVSSGRRDQVVSAQWAIVFVQRLFDKTSARIHCEVMNALILQFGSFLLIARMQDGADVVLPVGIFTTTDFGWTVPPEFENSQETSVTLGWDQLGMPCTIDVPGLSTIVPKLV